MAGRRCPAKGCPKILTQGERYCPTHAREYEGRRGTPVQRGYDQAHRARRAAWQARIDAGQRVTCARCCQPIRPAEPWALDHDDLDRTKYLGPSHASCNNAAGGRNAHR